MKSTIKEIQVEICSFSIKPDQFYQSVHSKQIVLFFLLFTNQRVSYLISSSYFFCINEEDFDFLMVMARERTRRCYSDEYTSSSTVAKVSTRDIESGESQCRWPRERPQQRAAGLVDTHSWTSATFSAFQFTRQEKCLA